MTAARPSRGVAIVATGGYEGDSERLERTCRYFERRGLRVDRHLTPGAWHLRFAGTDDERLAWLGAAIDDPAVDLVIVQRGGYGATRLLPRIPFDEMAAAVADGKRFVGHSDFTAISLGLLASTGAISFAGPMASFGFGGEAVDAFTEVHFWRAMDESRVDVEFATPFRAEAAAEGPLWGGNLAMLTSLVGTRWMPAVDGGILFVEDVNEQPYRVERMLLQLKYAGVLDRQRMILCGDFNGYRVAAQDHGYDMADVLDHVRGMTTTPIVAGLPFGHNPRKLTLAVGAPATVRVAGGVCRLEQRWAFGATDARPDSRVRQQASG